MPKFAEHFETIRKSVKIDIRVDYDKHKPTENEMNNICFMAMKYGAGHIMRQVDLAMVNTLGGTPDTVRGLSDRWIPSLADYMWDHIMGEPDDPSPEEMVDYVTFVRDMIYTMDETCRNSIDDLSEEAS